MDKIKVGITGTGSLIGQAIIKSIKASSLYKNVSMTGFDYFKDTIGSFWVEKNYLLPDFLMGRASHEEWLGEIIKAVNSEGMDIIFIGLDFELAPFARYKNVIESRTGCKVMVSSQDVIEISDDKYLTYKFLKDNGFYYPETFLPEDGMEKKIKFPCFIKPRTGSRSRHAFIINDPEQLSKIAPGINSPVIQELVGRPDSEYTCGVICFEGEVKESIVLRRDLKDGNTEIACFNKGAPGIIYDYISKVAARLKPFGACNFQLRLDADGIPKIFEINARHSGTTYIRALFGFNEVEYILCHMSGLKIKKFNLREGMVKRYYEEMFIRP